MDRIQIDGGYAQLLHMVQFGLRALDVTTPEFKFLAIEFLVFEFQATFGQFMPFAQDFGRGVEVFLGG